MAYFTIEFFSQSLLRPVQFKMIIPNDRADCGASRRMRTLFLLHGYTGSAGNWVPEYLAEKYNFAIVMPNGENSFWVDGISTGHKFGEFIGEELVGYIRKTLGLAMTADETYIMGLSMGGFGALRTALAYPENFGKTAALSSALIIHSVAEMRPVDKNSHANYEYYRECFGELDKAEKSRNNPEVLAEEILTKGGKMPEIFMACGTEDFLLENNRQFHSFLSDKEIPHVYLESKGGHDMQFWDEYAKKFIEMMFGEGG